MLTGVFRASYAYVFEPQVPRNGGDPKYQITMLIPKSDTTTLQAIQAGINQALQDGLQRVFGGQMPARPEMPLYDGDGVRKNGEPFGDECRGCWVIRASSKNRPSVVDINVQPIIDPNAFYSGCYARASINFFAYSKNGNRGVACGLNNIQKIADGEPLSGRTTVEEDFGGKNAWNGLSTYGTPLSASPMPNAPTAPAARASISQPVTGYMFPATSGFPVRPVVGYPEGMPGYGQDVAAQAPPYPAMAPTAGMVDPVTGLSVNGGVMGI